MSKKVLFFIIAAVVIIVIAVVLSKGEKAPNNVSREEQEQNEAQERVYTMEEVAKHNTKDDCWMVIHGDVYDVTAFIDSHPGGLAILQGCGKDATELFETRPMGSGTPHSDKAREILEKYEIGELSD